MEPFCNHFDQFGFEFDVLQYSGVDLERFLSRTGAHNSDWNLFWLMNRFIWCKNTLNISNVKKEKSGKKCCQLQLMTAMIKVLLSNLGSCAKYFHIFYPIKSFRLKLFDILTLKLWIERVWSSNILALSAHCCTEMSWIAFRMTFWYFASEFNCS